MQYNVLSFYVGTFTTKESLFCCRKEIAELSKKFIIAVPWIHECW